MLMLKKINEQINHKQAEYDLITSNLKPLVEKLEMSEVQLCEAITHFLAKVRQQLAAGEFPQRLADRAASVLAAAHVLSDPNTKGMIEPPPSGNWEATLTAAFGQDKTESKKAIQELIGMGNQNAASAKQQYQERLQASDPELSGELGKMMQAFQNVTSAPQQQENPQQNNSQQHNSQQKPQTGATANMSAGRSSPPPAGPTPTMGIGNAKP